MATVPLLPRTTFRSRPVVDALWNVAFLFVMAAIAGSALQASPQPRDQAVRPSVREPQDKPRADPPPASTQKTTVGSATYIAQALEGKRTASGDIYHGRAMVAAHRTYPLGTRLRVTNLTNGRSVVVRVVDRTGPGTGADQPIVDLSRRAAERLDFIRAGRVRVKIEVLEWGSRPKSR